MVKRLAVPLALAWAIAGCDENAVIPAPPPGEAVLASAAVEGLVRLEIPAEDPGPPFYARVGLQFFHSDGWIGIPFYRPPECVPADFNLLEFFHFPGPGGPGAFACELLASGFLLIEPDAPLGTFPRQVMLRGDGAVPFWFLPSSTFQDAVSDGVLTMGELEALSPLRATASSFHETLHPRMDEHKIIINAGGRLEDGRAFRFHVTEIDHRIQSIRITIR